MSNRYQFEEAIHQLERYGGEPDERITELLWLVSDLNDDLMHMRDTRETKARLVAKIAAI